MSKIFHVSWSTPPVDVTGVVIQCDMNGVGFVDYSAVLPSPTTHDITVTAPQGAPIGVRVIFVNAVGRSLPSNVVIVHMDDVPVPPVITAT